MKPFFFNSLFLISLVFFVTMDAGAADTATYTLLDYRSPLATDTIWMYQGRDWDGIPSATRVQIISDNQPITAYTNGSSSTPYTASVVDFLFSSGQANPDGSFSATDDWHEYQTLTVDVRIWGDDDDGASVRADGGLNFGVALTIGQTRETSASAYSSGNYIGELTASISLIGIETVTVPGGTFDDCLHLRFNIDDSQRYDEWWAKGAGVVRMEGVSGAGSGRLRELVSLEIPSETIHDPDVDGDGGNPPESLSQTQVSQLYVSIFGRASEGDGNSYWQGRQLTMASTAMEMLNSPAAAAYFGDALNTDQAFVEHIYSNTLGKTVQDDPDGIAYWVGRLMSQEITRGGFAAQMAYVLANGDFTGDPEAIAAQARFNNRVEICNYTADKILSCPDVTDLSDFVSFISGTTSDYATVDSMTAAIDAYNPQLLYFSYDQLSGKTFTVETDPCGCERTFYFINETQLQVTEPDANFIVGYTIEQGEIVLSDERGETSKSTLTLLAQNADGFIVQMTHTQGDDQWVEEPELCAYSGPCVDASQLGASGANEIKDWILENGLRDCTANNNGTLVCSGSNFDGRWWVEDDIFYFDYPEGNYGCVDSKAYQMKNFKLYFATDADYTQTQYWTTKQGSNDI